MNESLTRLDFDSTRFVEEESFVFQPSLSLDEGALIFNASILWRVLPQPGPCNALHFHKFSDLVGVLPVIVIIEWLVEQNFEKRKIRKIEKICEMWQIV